MIRYGVVLVLFLSEMAIADAQLFGQRTLGRPLGRQPRAAALSNTSNADAGRVTGTERFIRGNRDRNSFVGADQGETQSFVGSQQGSTGGVIVSSTAGIEAAVDRSAEINEVLETPQTKKMYLPKIVLAADLYDGIEPVPELSVIEQVTTTVNLASSRRIEVSVLNQTATLRGAVSSQKEKRLAETLARFEPGIWKVDNQLRVEQPTRQNPSPLRRTQPAND